MYNIKGDVANFVNIVWFENNPNPILVLLIKYIKQKKLFIVN